MANLSPTKVPVPEQDPNVRNHNFEEVNLGYTPEMAVEEAGRCLQCKKPACVAGCPVNIQIPEFIAKVAEGDFQAAYEIIHQTNGLPAVSGRVCPQESQCESLCVRGKKGEPVAIGRLERFVADWYRNNVHAKPEKPASNGVKVAVVGSGPAGLTCASDLGKLGYQVSIFEAFHTAGGVLVYGIPQFRLPKEIVQHEVEGILDLGVELDLDTVIGKTITIDELFEMGYRAVFVGSGAGLPMFMDIPGETLSGVYSANEYLTRVNLMKAYREEYDTPIKKSKSVAVVGALTSIACFLMLAVPGSPAAIGVESWIMLLAWVAIGACFYFSRASILRSIPETSMQYMLLGTADRPLLFTPKAAEEEVFEEDDAKSAVELG